MRAVLALGVMACLGAAAFAPACGDARSHIFVARVYDAVHGCVSPSQGIDVVDGPGPSGAACPPVCVIDPAGNVSISGMCPPYPVVDTIEGPDGGLDPTCTLAMAIYNCNITCGADAGPDGGLPLTDASSCLPGAGDAAPAVEAGAETGADGSARD